MRNSDPDRPYGDWIWLDDRIDKVSSEIEEISRVPKRTAVNVMTIPGIGPMISTAMVAAVVKGEAFDRGRDFAAWVGLVPRQYSTGGRTVSRTDYPSAAADI